MANPAASIKSIYRGKSSVDTPDDPESVYSFEDQFYYSDQDLTKIGEGSLSSKNLRALNSINASDCSSEDNAEANLDTDTQSLALSRNSTTSCLSTTATKDGIEGRKLHRNGPNAYSNQVIANMIRNLDDTKKRTPTSPNALPSPLEPIRATTPPPDDAENYSYSDSSLRTTDAIIDGEKGLKDHRFPDQAPLSLLLKMKLLNPSLND